MNDLPANRELVVIRGKIGPVRTDCPSFRSEWDFEEAINTLNRYGLLTKPRHDRIKILDNRSVKA